MESVTGEMTDTRSQDEPQVQAVYRQWLDGWNGRNADVMAGLCDDDTEIIGFDGSLMVGRAEVLESMRQVFVDHETAPYTVQVKRVRLLSPEVAVLRAEAGMVPPGKMELEPALNAWHTLVAAKRDGAWRIAFFQNTPAQFHGRPELVQQMTEELRRVIA